MSIVKGKNTSKETSNANKRHREEGGCGGSGLDKTSKDDIIRGQKLLNSLEASKKRHISPADDKLHYRGFYAFAQNADFMLRRLLGDGIRRLNHPLEARNQAREELHSIAAAEVDSKVRHALAALLQMADVEVAKVNAYVIPHPFKYRKTNNHNASSSITTPSENNRYDDHDNTGNDNEMETMKIVDLDLFSGKQYSTINKTKTEDIDGHSSDDNTPKELPCMKPLLVRSKKKEGTSSVNLVTTGFQFQEWGHINDMDNYFNFLRCVICFLEGHPMFQISKDSFKSLIDEKIQDARTQVKAAVECNLKLELSQTKKKLTLLKQELTALETNSSKNNIAIDEAAQSVDMAQQALVAFQLDMVITFFIFSLNFFCK